MITPAPKKDHEDNPETNTKKTSKYRLSLRVVNTISLSVTAKSDQSLAPFQKIEAGQGLFGQSSFLHLD
jgi:hypothetical protein